MTNKSYWKDTETIRERHCLPGDMNIDTVIIGGGMAGILTAYFLKQKGKEWNPDTNKKMEHMRSDLRGRMTKLEGQMAYKIGRASCRERVLRLV